MIVVADCFLSSLVIEEHSKMEKEKATSATASFVLSVADFTITSPT